MNKQRREGIQKAINFLLEAQGIVENASSDESDARDNLPENLQDSDRAYEMDDNVDHLDDAASSIEQAIDNLQNIN